jgi:16S rRNA (uracil1498-N3)-methyltransferase
MAKRHRFIGDFPLHPGRLRVSDADLVHQMHSVLKLAPEEELILGDGKMHEALCRLVSYEKHAVIIDVLEVHANANEPARDSVLFCAILKKELFELVAQKATEVGVREIIPVITARTVKLNLRADRLEKIVREAAEQAGRGQVPIVQKAMPLDEALEYAKHNDVNILFDVGKAGPDLPREVRRVGIFIGPEGGWQEQEIELAREYGCRIAGLGPLTLRGETAAIIASYLVLHV